MPPQHKPVQGSCIREVVSSRGHGDHMVQAKRRILNLTDISNPTEMGRSLQWHPNTHRQGVVYAKCWRVVTETSWLKWMEETWTSPKRIFYGRDKSSDEKKEKKAGDLNRSGAKFQPNCLFICCAIFAVWRTAPSTAGDLYPIEPYCTHSSSSHGHDWVTARNSCFLRPKPSPFWPIQYFNVLVFQSSLFTSIVKAHINLSVPRPTVPAFQY